MAHNLRIISIISILLLVQRTTADVSLFNGAQNITLSQKLSKNCNVAFNTSLTCPSTVQLLTYPNQQVEWNTTALGLLCTSACNSSLTTLRSAVVNGCGSEKLLLSGSNLTYPQMIDLYQYKYNIVCMKDPSSGAFCSDIENAWNITQMLAQGKATWPTYTNKTYYDLSRGSWDPYTDENGTLIRLPDEVNWMSASQVSTGMNPVAMDYFKVVAAPIDDSNYGWAAVLSADELPTQIQCSSCFVNRYIRSMQSTWGDPWDEMASQVWANMQKNCGISTKIIPANNVTHTAYLIDELFPTMNYTNCPLVLNLTQPLTCATAGLQYSVASRSILQLNFLDCGHVQGMICSAAACPITVSTQTLPAKNFALQYTNFTLTQFLAWNPYIYTGLVDIGETVCVGPPGGSYDPPAATPAQATVYTKTAKATAPTLSGTISNCGRYYNVSSGDYCNTVALNFSITLNQLLNMNCNLDAKCDNLYAGYDYCVGAVNGTTVTTCPTHTTTATTSAGSTTVPAPGPTQSGTTASCRLWYTVVSGDTCSAIETKYAITSTQFYKWNAGVNAGCTNLYVGDAYCVAGP